MLCPGRKTAMSSRGVIPLVQGDYHVVLASRDCALAVPCNLCVVFPSPQRQQGLNRTLAGAAGWGTIQTSGKARLGPWSNGAGQKLTVIDADFTRDQLVEQCIHPQQRVAVAGGVNGEIVHLVWIGIEIEKLHVVVLEDLLQGLRRVEV